MNEPFNGASAKAGSQAATRMKIEGSTRAGFVGTWLLAALGGEGPLVERLGTSPLGILIYDGSGNMSVQIMNREYGAFPLATDHDFKAALQSYIAYFGSYSIDTDERSVTHHVAGSLHPRNVGRHFKRLYEFSDDQLILTAHGTISGEHIAAQLFWKRATDGNRFE